MQVLQQIHKSSAAAFKSFDSYGSFGNCAILHTRQMAAIASADPRQLGHGCLQQQKGESMSASRKMLKAVALIAVLTGVMLGSSGCITIDLGAPGLAAQK